MPGSELSRLNQRAGQPVRVSALLYSVLNAALVATQATEGVFDPTLERQMVALGYDRTFAKLPAPSGCPRASDGTDISSGTPGAAWRRILVDRSDRQVPLLTGVGLDFGGIAKDMAVDAAIERLRQEDIETALVNAGGDLAVLGSS